MNHQMAYGNAFAAKQQPLTEIAHEAVIIFFLHLNILFLVLFFVK